MLTPVLTALRKKVQKCTEVGETFECRGPHKAQINCSEYVSVAGSLVVEMHVPDVTLRVNKPN